MKILILIIAVLAVSQAMLCDEPQRAFYMSYSALGKRDALNNLFDEITKSLTALDCNYTDNNLQANFKIPALQAGTYYNDHHQTETFIERLSVNVTMGEISVGSLFNYSIAYSGSTKSGQIFAKAKLDPSYFTKNLTMIAGFL